MFVAVPMTATLSSVPMPGRSPSGHQSRRIGMPSTIADRPEGQAGQLPDPLVEGLPRPEAETGLGHQGDPKTERDQPEQESGSRRTTSTETQRSRIAGW